MGEILRVSNISKTFGENNSKVNALTDLSFSITSQTFASIIGRSGSGKTTLLNMIGGLEAPTSGEIQINNMNPYQLNDDKRSEFRRRNIGYVFQFFNLLPELTAYDNICLPSYLDHHYPDKTFLKQVTNQLSLDSLLDKFPGELSGGEQQRVAVARALSCMPKIILADEPTGNLDKKSGNELMDLLHFSCRLFKQTILLVTHDLEIARSADRIITLEDGRILSDLSGEFYVE